MGNGDFAKSKQIENREQAFIYVTYHRMRAEVGRWNLIWRREVARRAPVKRQGGCRGRALTLILSTEDKESRILPSKIHQLSSLEMLPFCGVDTLADRHFASFLLCSTLILCHVENICFVLRVVEQQYAKGCSVKQTTMVGRYSILIRSDGY